MAEANQPAASSRADPWSTAAEALSDLVECRLPIHLPQADPSSRSTWDVSAPAILARLAHALRALFRLDPSVDSHLVAETIARSIIEQATTFAWLAGDPETRLPEWIAGTDLERLKADNRFRVWLPGSGYDEGPKSILDDDLRELVNETASRIRSLADRAVQADTSWRTTIPELRAAGCSFSEIYASAYASYSFSAHALLQPLYRFVGRHPEGGVVVGCEGLDPDASPWHVAVLVVGLGLLVAGHALTWPDIREVRAALNGLP